MSNEVLVALIGLMGTALITLVGAILLGKLVPASQVTRAEKEAEAWKTSYEQLRQSSDQQVRMLDRLQLSAEITDKVMQAIGHTAGALPGSGPPSAEDR